MTAAVRMSPLAERHARVAPAVEAAALGVLRSGGYVRGPEGAALEAALAALHGRAHAVGVGSGTDALAFALQALGVGPGDEVIVPAVGFYGTAAAVLALGAVPVLADVLPGRPLLCPAAAAAAVGPRTVAVVPVHLYGDLAEDPALPGLAVVDDLAQAIGRRPPGGPGRAAALSFYPTKALGAAGDGGMVLTDDASVAAAVRALGHQGYGPDGLHHAAAGAAPRNSRLDELQAAIVRAQLPDLGARLARRRAVAAAYDAVLGARALPRDAESPVSVYAFRVAGRDAARAALAARGVESAVYYPVALGDQPALAGRVRGGPAPSARAFCAQVLCVPCHEALTDDEVARVCAALEELA